LLLATGCNNRDRPQNWQGMSRNYWRVTEYRDANSAAAGVAGGGGMGVSSFQRMKHQNQQYAAQRDPAPEPARLELSPMDDTHSLVLLDYPEYSTRTMQHQPDSAAANADLLP
jgi:hypothetical protein